HVGRGTTPSLPSSVSPGLRANTYSRGALSITKHGRCGMVPIASVCQRDTSESTFFLLSFDADRRVSLSWTRYDEDGSHSESAIVEKRLLQQIVVRCDHIPYFGKIVLVIPRL
ncbi:hypothetical protein HAX54_042591, partial [Datura stramonium]|nr:hypothetical protein [Datura stramonium]